MRKLEKKVQILPNQRQLPKISSGWKSKSQQSIKNIELNFRMKPYFVKYSFSLNKYLHTLALAWQVLQRIQAKQNHIESKQCRIEPIYINSVISNKNYIWSTISNVMKLNGWEHHIFPFSIGSVEKGYIMSKNWNLYNKSNDWKLIHHPANDCNWVLSKYTQKGWSGNALIE